MVWGPSGDSGGTEWRGAETGRQIGAPRGGFTVPIRGKLQTANVIIN